MVVMQFEGCLINLDSTGGSEIQKTHPGLIISLDEMIRHIATVMVALVTIKGRSNPTRVDRQFEGKPGQIVLDQINTVDKSYLVKKPGKISDDAQCEVLTVQSEIFSE